MFASLSILGLALMPFVSAAIHDIQVGAEGKLVYSPEAIAAQPGDQVIFHFHAKNHTVTQSSFADPCGLKEGGINSGFHPVPANQTDNLPTFTVTVNDTKPIWVYCAQAAKLPTSHCGAGMVFAINCGADNEPNSFTNFKKAALAVGDSLKANAPPATTSSAPYGGAYTTAAYGGYTIPAAPTPVPVTVPVTLGSQSWTTTYNSYPNSPAPTPASAEGNVIKVVVGGPGKLLFNPSHVTASPRDKIVFEFQVKNHTVSQSTFDDPCRPFNVNGATGFDSGFVPVAADATTFPTWNLTVNDTAPIWAYCRQANHCGQGMVFSVNSDESSQRNFAAFESVAKALNGTAAADTAPSSTSAGASKPTGAASTVKIGGASIALFVAAVVGALL